MKLWLVAITALFIIGCGSIPEESRDHRDPWQAYNRAMFQFNTDFDNAFLKPTAKAYRFITPEPVDRGVTNFFDNIADISSAVNNFLQFKLSRAGSDIGRVLVNSTLGIGGLFDVATNMGLKSYKEDFGQTLGYWGFASGPYFVLPIVGPSSVRGAFGFAGDMFIDPFYSVDKNEVYWGLMALRLIDRRADLLEAMELVDDAALDRYSFVRDAYLARREAAVRDGEVQPVDNAEDFFWDGDLEDIPSRD